jgi:hypothetical protein
MPRSASSSALVHPTGPAPTTMTLLAMAVASFR